MAIFLDTCGNHASDETVDPITSLDSGSYGQAAHSGSRTAQLVSVSGLPSLLWHCNESLVTNFLIGPII